jgi:hypothetical protein
MEIINMDNPPRYHERSLSALATPISRSLLRLGFSLA